MRGRLTWFRGTTCARHLIAACSARLVVAFADITAIDTGFGIPAEVHEMVLGTGRTTGGTSLGLVTVAAVADVHSWTVKLPQSESGRVRFEFEI